MQSGQLTMDYFSTLEEMDLAFGVCHQTHSPGLLLISYTQDNSGTAAADREHMAEISKRIGLSRLTGEAEPGHAKPDISVDEKRSVEHSE
jgi:hypothetical protein